MVVHSICFHDGLNHLTNMVEIHYTNREMFKEKNTHHNLNVYAVGVPQSSILGPDPFHSKYFFL